MTLVRIEPYLGDQLLAPEGYDQLLDDLRQAGYEVELRAPLEKKGVDAALVDIAIHVLGAIEDHAVEALVGYAAGRLRGRSRRGKPRRLRIFGPRGEVLREVELPEE